MLRLLGGIANLVTIAAAALITYQVLTDPVSYSFACFQPSQEARLACYRQQFVQQLASLLLVEPHQLMRNKPLIVEYYRRAWLSGMFPRSRMTPHELSRLIDEIVNARLGLPI